MLWFNTGQIALAGYQSVLLSDTTYQQFDITYILGSNWSPSLKTTTLNGSIVASTPSPQLNDSIFSSDSGQLGVTIDDYPHEIVMWNQDLTSQRANIENAVNSYYNAY